MTHTTQAIQVDTRPMASKDRRSLVFWAFDHLDTDATMELLNDQDPLTLRSQFELEKPNLFTWEPLESGPDVWRVAVTKLKGKHGVDHCCGACGG
ncbi:MAG: DUF2249 domain-containing protein [Rhodoferax sp.]|jgi:uncharacterized protein (DUF2249 family)